MIEMLVVLSLLLAAVAGHVIGYLVIEWRVRRKRVQAIDAWSKAWRQQRR